MAGDAFRDLGRRHLGARDADLDGPSVGNEDGAHNAGAVLFQGLNDVGFTIPAHGMTYWVGEAMHKVDYQDLEHRPAKTREATEMAATNAAHLAQLLRGNGYPKIS